MCRAARLSASLVLALPFVLLTQLHAQAPAAGVFRGRVLDRSTGQPISAAEIAVSGHPATTSSDPDGRWSLPPLAPGGYLLRVLRIGYAPASLRVSLASGDTSKVEVRLTP